MKNSKLAVAALIASVVMSASSLAVSLTNSGPQGPRGVQGKQGARGPAGAHGNTGKDAEVAHLGVCVTTDSSDIYNDTVFYVDGVSSPTLINGVPSCPAGSFVPITPQKEPQ